MTVRIDCRRDPLIGRPRRRSRSPRSSAWTTCGWRWSSTPCRPRSAACWCAARRAPPSRPPCAALAAVLPPVDVVAGCRFSCDPAEPDPSCPDGPHDACAAGVTRPARLVELPVGASDDRLTGSLDLERALTEGVQGLRARPARRRPPRRALRRRGQPAARPPRRPAARLGRAGHQLRRARRRLGAPRGPVPARRHDEPRGGRAAPAAARPVRADRVGRGARATRPSGPRWCGGGWRSTPTRPRSARASPPTRPRWPTASSPPATLLPSVELTDAVLRTITSLCAAFEVDGLRADLVMARTAAAHAAWRGRHRGRRRRHPGRGPAGPAAPAPAQPVRRARGRRAAARRRARSRPTRRRRPTRSGARPGSRPDGPDPGGGSGGRLRRSRDAETPRNRGRAAAAGSGRDRPHRPAPPFRARLLQLPTVGTEIGAAGRRSRARSVTGRVTRAERPSGRLTRLHLTATLLAAAPASAGPRPSGRPAAWILQRDDLRQARVEGREGNLVLFVVDASGSMAARPRMSAVTGAVLSLLLDAYQRRDKVGLITFRGDSAELVLPPTSSVEAGAARLGRPADRWTDAAGRRPAACGRGAAGREAARPAAAAAARRADRRPGDQRPGRR